MQRSSITPSEAEDKKKDTTKTTIEHPNIIDVIMMDLGQKDGEIKGQGITSHDEETQQEEEEGEIEEKETGDVLDDTQLSTMEIPTNKGEEQEKEVEQTLRQEVLP